MKKGWVKLYRKITDNRFLMRNHTARNVFMMLLVIVDWETGSWSGGIAGQLTKITGVKESTLRGSLKSLQSNGIIASKPCHDYTIIYICKWHEYQGQSSSEPASDTSQPRDSLKNKEIRTKNKENTNKDSTNVLATQDTRNVELQSLIDHAKAIQFPSQGSDRFNRYSASNCLKKYGLDPCKRLVSAAVKCRGEPYSPLINDFGQLYKKAGDLASFIKSKQIKGEKNHVTVI